MQLAAEVRMPNLKRGATIDLEKDFKMRFRTSQDRKVKKATPRLSIEQASAYSRARWCAAVGMVQERVPSPSREES